MKINLIVNQCEFKKLCDISNGLDITVDKLVKNLVTDYISKQVQLDKTDCYEQKGCYIQPTIPWY